MTEPAFYARNIHNNSLPHKKLPKAIYTLINHAIKKATSLKVAFQKSMPIHKAYIL